MLCLISDKFPYNKILPGEEYFTITIGFTRKVDGKDVDDTNGLLSKQQELSRFIDDEGHIISVDITATEAEAFVKDLVTHHQFGGEGTVTKKKAVSTGEKRISRRSKEQLFEDAKNGDLSALNCAVVRKAIESGELVLPEGVIDLLTKTASSEPEENQEYEEDEDDYETPPDEMKNPNAGATDELNAAVWDIVKQDQETPAPPPPPAKPAPSPTPVPKAGPVPPVSVGQPVTIPKIPPVPRRR